MKQKKLFTTFILLVCFFLWILPLGAFIDVAKEGKVCGGLRAFCLCSSQFVNRAKTVATKPMIARGSSVEKEGGLFGSANRSFVPAKFDPTPPFADARYYDLIISVYSLLVPRAIEHVPKI